MSYFDKNIPYLDEKKWIEYFETKIIPLYELTDKIIKIYNNIRQFDEKDLNTYYNIPFLVSILLGGLNSNAEFEQNSIAYFYKHFFGFGIKDEKDLSLRLKQDREINLNQDLKMTIKVIKAPFYDQVKKINNLIETILEQIKGKFLIKNPVFLSSNDEDLSNPIQVVEIIQDFLNKSLEISLMYNSLTFFLLTLDNRLPRHYIQSIYTKLKEKENFQKIIDWFGMYEYFKPTVPNEEIKNKYTLYEMKEEFLGKNLLKLNFLIWDLFLLPEMMQKLKTFFDLENIDQLNQYDYYKKVSKARLENLDAPFFIKDDANPLSSQLSYWSYSKSSGFPAMKN